MRSDAGIGLSMKAPKKIRRQISQLIRTLDKMVKPGSPFIRMFAKRLDYYKKAPGIRLTKRSQEKFFIEWVDTEFEYWKQNQEPICSPKRRSVLKSAFAAGADCAKKLYDWQPTLNPFLGSGTTGKMALLLDREFIGIECDADYIRIARSRMRNRERV